VAGVLTYLGVAVLGGLGAVARYRLSAAVAKRIAARFPLGTLVVNLTGTLALAVVVGAAVSDRAELLLGTGLLGGYTTFSTWMVETEQSGEAGEVVLLVANVAVPMLLGLAAAALGYVLGQAI
jgi:fluoride exporter